MTNEAEKLADILGDYNCTCDVAYKMRGRTDPQCHACHVEPEAKEAAALLRSQAAEIERKNALLREALRALKYHTDQTRPIERTFDTMDKIKEELK